MTYRRNALPRLPTFDTASHIISAPFRIQPFKPLELSVTQCPRLAG